MAELHIYDFDGTLFRSPHSPATWKGDWWSDPASLMAPCVPEKPPSDWWNQPVLAKARASISSPDVFALLMTGRKDKSAFRYRVPELLRQVGLRFDVVHLVGGNHPDGTIAGKLAVMRKTLRDFPFITKIVVYDDRPTHLKAFKDLGGRMGLEVETHLVRALSMTPMCGEDFEVEHESKKAKYLGVFLDAASKAILARAFPFEHETIQNDHVTLVIDPKSSDLALVGLPVEMRVVGYASDVHAQAVAVQLPSAVPYVGKSRPHVTLSHDPSVGPVYSNTLILGGDMQPVRGMVLRGVVDTFPRTLSASGMRVVAQYLMG
jgi:hypothetical protein